MNSTRMERRWRLLFRIFDTIGIKVLPAFLQDGSTFTYKSNTLFMNVNLKEILTYGSDEDDLNNIVHELAHWIVASPQQCKRVDYGLAPNTFNSLAETKSLIVQKEILRWMGCRNLSQEVKVKGGDTQQHVRKAWRWWHEEGKAEMHEILQEILQEIFRTHPYSGIDLRKPR